MCPAISSPVCSRTMPAPSVTAAQAPKIALARARLDSGIFFAFACPIGSFWASGADPVAPSQVDEVEAGEPEERDQERGRLDPNEERVSGQLRAHDRDREHEDHEQPL